MQVPGAPDLAGDPGRPVDGRAAHAQEPHLQDRAGAALPALHRQPRVQDQGGARAHAADRGGAPGERVSQFSSFNGWQHPSISTMCGAALAKKWLINVRGSVGDSMSAVIYPRKETGLLGKLYSGRALGPFASFYPATYYKRQERSFSG